VKLPPSQWVPLTLMHFACMRDAAGWSECRCSKDIGRGFSVAAARPLPLKNIHAHSLEEISKCLLSWLGSYSAPSHHMPSMQALIVEQQPATSLLETGRQSGCQRLSLPPVHLPCRVIVCREITGGVRISVGVSIMKALVVLGSITHPGKVEQ